jgi:hypothetical protein
MLSVSVEGGEVVVQALEDMGKRAARSVIMPAMKAPWGSVAAAERAGVNSISGALAASLRVRSGAGDRPGRYSVYVSATATVKQAVRKWSRSPRKQHHGFALRAQEFADETGLGRYRIFYGPWVEMGHRLVKGGPLRHGGRVVGHVAPKPFAGPAFEAGAEQAAEEAANAVTDAVLGD